MDLPDEITALIMHHLQANATTLRDLRPALACRSFYHQARPAIKNCYIDLLVVAIDKRCLQIQGIVNRREQLQALFHNGTEALRLDVRLESITFTVSHCCNPDVIWSVKRLLSRIRSLHITPRLFRLALGEEPRVDGNCRARWSFALSRLLSTTLKMQETEVQLVGAGWDGSRRYRPHQHHVGVDVEAPISGTVRLTSLYLYGSTFHPFTFSRLTTILHLASSSLTQLRLHKCMQPQEDWSLVLSGLNLSRLWHFGVFDMAMPISALAAFLGRHPTVTHATLEAYTTTEPREERRSSQVQSLVCTIEILHALTQTSITFPMLERLTIIGLHHYSPGPDEWKYSSLDDLTSVLSHLQEGAPRLRELALYLGYTPTLDGWLASAWPPPKLEGPPGPPGYFLPAESNGTPPLAAALGGLRQVKRLCLSVRHKTPQGGIPFSTTPFPIVPSLLAGFLGAFPSLEEYSENGHQSDSVAWTKLSGA